MYVFVDESGDAGFRFREGSSRYFTVAAVVFEDLRAVAECQQLIEQARVANNVSRDVMLHYYTDHPRIRRAVIASVEAAAFRVLSVTIDKWMLPADRLRGSGHTTAYLRMAEYAMTRFAPELDAAVIVMDGSGSQQFQRMLSGRLRNAANGVSSGALRRVRIRRPAQNPMLQLADYCAGIATRWALADREAQELRRRLRLKWQHAWHVERWIDE